MKRFYALAAAALACVANANAQSEVKEDWDIVAPFEWSDYSGTEGVAIYGVTATVKAFALQVAGLPVSPAGGFTPVILGNGGVIKFFDNPEASMPSEDTWSDADQELSDEWGWTWDDLAGYQGSNTALPFDFVIEGEGNEIYLDSYCTMGGTLTGNGSVTIYASSRSQLGFSCANTLNEAYPAFNGTIYLKGLDGYACDTINFASTFRGADAAGKALAAAAYSYSTSIFDVNGLNNPVLDMSSIGSKTCVPPVNGKATVKVVKMPHLYSATGNAWYNSTDDVMPLDYTLEGGAGDAATELYSGIYWLRGQCNEAGLQVYLRSEGALVVDSKEPSFSNHTQSISARGAGSSGYGKTGFVGGNGYIDQYIDNNSNPVYISAGHPWTSDALGWNTLGELTVRGITMRNANIMQVDFAGNASDVINVTNVYHFHTGRNDFKLAFADDYFETAVPGNYLVINAKHDSLDAGYSTLVDTIGYEVWDNNGCAYVVRSVKGGETIVDAITGEERVAAPGDSIGSASFGNLASKFGATCMDGNRPHYVIKNWGFGTYSDGKSVDDRYIGSTTADYDGTYVVNPDEIGTWARGAEGYYNDSLAWEAVWEQFKADHPCSSSQEAVTPEDPSVIPGTVTDSIFLTYSYTSVMENHDAHNWSWKNGSGYESSVKGYPYAGAITKPYFYYSNNTFYVNQSGTIRSAAGDSIAAYDWSKTTLPATRYTGQIETGEVDENGNPIMANDPATAYKSWSTGKASVPQADGTTMRYWFNFKNILDYGVIALCYEKVDAEGNVLETNADAQGACVSEDIVNSDQKLDINTLLKESHAVATRVIYSLDGKRLNTYAKGLNVVTTKYTDGTIETKKVFIAE